LTAYSFSWRAIYHRFQGTSGMASRWMKLLRSLSTEGAGRIKYHSEIRPRLGADPEVAPYFEQQTKRLPQVYADLVRRDLGSLWSWLPQGALSHDPNAYLRSKTRPHLEPAEAALPQAALV